MRNSFSVAAACLALAAAGASRGNVDTYMNCPVAAAALHALPANHAGAAIPATLRQNLQYFGAVVNAPNAHAPCAGLDPHRFVMAADAGGVQWAYATKVTHEFDIYRTYGGPAACANPTANGNWWSYADPRHSAGANTAARKAHYRTANAVCSSWNTFAKVIKCRVKVGAIIAIGPTQSVSAQTCSCAAALAPGGAPHVSAEHFAAGHEFQMFINLYNKDRDQIMKCEAPQNWN